MIQIADGGMAGLLAEGGITTRERAAWTAVSKVLEAHPDIGVRAALSRAGVAAPDYYRARKFFRGEADQRGNRVATDAEAFGFHDNDMIRPKDAIIERPVKKKKRLLEEDTARPLRKTVDVSKALDVDPSPTPAADEILIAVLCELRRADPIDQRRIIDASRAMLGLVEGPDNDRRYMGFHLGSGESAPENLP